MKYYGYESKQEFIDVLKESEVQLEYREAVYDVWLDGMGNCIALTYLNGRYTTNEECDATLKAYKTVEELVDDYVFYDGVKLADVLEMDTSEY